MKRIGFFISSVFLALLIMVSSCFASQYAIKEMTPSVNRALKGRQARYAELQTLKRAGAVGENNRGYVTSLGGGSSGAVVSAENADREVIYRTLVDQNSLGANGMREVEKAFAEVQAEKAAPGEMVQSAAGDWQAKA
jgi:uncharacterized protein YdbL (DUF1318 family)